MNNTPRKAELFTNAIRKGDIYLNTDSYDSVAETTLYVVGEILEVLEDSVKLIASPVGTFDMLVQQDYNIQLPLRFSEHGLFLNNMVVLGHLNSDFPNHKAVPIIITESHIFKEMCTPSFKSAPSCNIFIDRCGQKVALDFGKETIMNTNAIVNDPWSAKMFVEFYQANNESEVMKRYSLKDKDELDQLVNKVINKYKVSY